MAINDAGMFTVKEINRLKILQDVIDRNIRPGQAEPPRVSWRVFYL
ncbi:hypothetical protein ACR929_20005 [Klebsiella pneumoniae]